MQPVRIAILQYCNIYFACTLAVRCCLVRAVVCIREASVRMHAAAIATTALLLLVGSAQSKDPATTPLNAWPMIMAHDAATTYLDPRGPIDYAM